jgi:hypothetical protein
VTPTSWLSWFSITIGIIWLVCFSWLARVWRSQISGSFDPHQRRALTLMGLSGAVLSLSVAPPLSEWRSPYAWAISIVALRSAVLMLVGTTVSIRRLISAKRPPFTLSDGQDTQARESYVNTSQ